jgi:hypothetical protein
MALVSVTGNHPPVWFTTAVLSPHQFAKLLLLVRSPNLEVAANKVE